MLRSGAGSTAAAFPLSASLGRRLGPGGVGGGLADEAAGGEFADVDGFRELLKDQEEQLLRNLAEQLTTYATGREIRFSDRDDIREIVAATAADGGGVRTLIRQIVRSDLFGRN